MNGGPIDTSEFGVPGGWILGIFGAKISFAGTVHQICVSSLKTIGQICSALRQAVQTVLSTLPLTQAQVDAALAQLNSVCNQLGQKILQHCRSNNVATGQCSVSHTARVPGAGLCCKHVGVELKNPGDHVSVTNAKGECGTCWLVSPGERVGKGGVMTTDPRFKHLHLQYTRGLGTCAAHKTGCCALQTMIAQGAARGLAL